MLTSEKTDIIDAALLDVQRKLKLLGKDLSATSDRSGTALKLRYASLELIYESCHDLLAENGITLWQGGERDQGTERLLTVLSKGGQQRVSSFPIIAREGAQNFGGGLGFAKRWGLQAAVGIFTTDKLAGPAADGYENAARPGRKAPAPAGLPDTLARITSASATGTFERLVFAARGAFPKGEEANAVGRTATAWLVDALGRADADGVTELRAMQARVKCAGSDLRQAIIDAEARVKAGAP